MHPHRSSALGYASAASAVHSRVYGACTAEAAASETSGLSVGGCPRARGYFGPYPVAFTLSHTVYRMYLTHLSASRQTADSRSSSVCVLELVDNHTPVHSRQKTSQAQGVRCDCAV